MICATRRLAKYLASVHTNSLLHLLRPVPRSEDPRRAKACVFQSERRALDCDLFISQSQDLAEAMVFFQGFGVRFTSVMPKPTSLPQNHFFSLAGKSDSSDSGVSKSSLSQVVDEHVRAAVISAVKPLQQDTNLCVNHPLKVLNQNPPRYEGHLCHLSGHHSERCLFQRDDTSLNLGHI